jgi:ABC-type proline/glycine betaine transport system permease subunit
MERIQTAVVLGLACLLAGGGPFVFPDPSARELAAAAAFSLPAVAPFFFGGRETGISACVIALALVTFASLTGSGALADVVVRHGLLARNLEMASAGALCGGLLAGILWARDIVASSRANG